MANPQKENGHTQIANELLSAIIKSNLTVSEYGVVLTVVRMTYGFNKKKDRISLTQLEQYTNKDRTSICRAIKTLVAKFILLVAKTPLGNEYGLNKDIGLLVNSSRGIIYASSSKDFAEKAREKAIELQLEMAEILAKNGI